VNHGRHPRARLLVHPPRYLMASAMAIILLTGLVPAALAGQKSAFTFSSQRGVATLVDHYTVTPADRATNPASATAGAADLSDQLPELDPKAFAHPESRVAPASPLAPLTRPKATTRLPSETPRPAASFIGQQGSNITCSYFPKGCNPPDMAIAASPRWVLQGVNTQWEVLGPSGHVGAGWPVSAQAFFGAPSSPSDCDPGSNNQPFLSDPRALYDAADHRFWAAMLQVEGAIGVATGCPEKTVYYIAVSQTSDPSGSWNVYVFDMSLGTTNVADFTQLGLNGDAVFFSANMFTQDGSAYAYAELFEANKARMEAGRGGFTADGFFNLSVSGPTGIQFLADTVQPALDLGGGSNSDGDWRSAGAEPFVDTFDAPDPITGNFCSSAADACSGLALWNLSNPTGHDQGGKAPTLTGTYVPNIQPYSFPPAADQPTCAQCIDASDLRISAIPMLQGGRIFAAWETGIDNGTTTVPGIEWAQIDVATAASKSGARSGYYFFGGHAAATYPALMPAPDGSLAMVYEYMSPDTNPQTRYVVRDSDSSQFQGRGVLLKAGEAAYRPTLCGSAIPVCRWGDYEAASFDGHDRVWVAGQYANIHTDPNAAPWFGRNWGTWIGAIDVH
jgi:hypothetical protein